MKKFSKCMALLATLSLLFSLFSCKQEPDDPDLSEVSVDLKEKEKVFFEGDTLSKEDVVVMAFYSDRSTKDVTNKAKFTPELPCTLTTSFDLTIDYEEKKAALKIEVGKKTDYYEDESGKRIKLKEISLALKNSDKQFFEGDVISKDDFVVKAKYEDDTTKIVTDGVTFEGLTDEKLTVGNKTIRATYGSQVKSLDIAVHERGAKVTSILLTLKAGRTFFVGDTISTDDFTVIAIFSDGTTEDVTNKSEFEGIGRTTTAGKVTIIASYDSKTKNCEVTVQAKTVASISLALKQQDKIVVVGDTISASDFIVTATYNNGTTEDVTSKSQISGLENLTQAGKVKITATYETKSASLDITVRANGVTLTDILLALKTDKTFVVGDTISKSDFIVTATFSDGATEDVTSASQFTGLGKITKAGNVEITVIYSSKITSITVKVTESNPVVKPEGLYIVGDFNQWDFGDGIIPMKKDGNCFYYEFEETGIIEFKICKTQGWMGQVFGGVAIPNTGVYVAPHLAVDLIYTENATVDIANSGDRVYVRYENGIYYVRYAAKGEIVDPDEEMEIVEGILFDIDACVDDGNEVPYWSDYVLEGERLKAIVVSYEGSVFFDYEYQWYRYKESVLVDSSPVSGETSDRSPVFEKGYFYYCVVTATARDNPRNIVKKKSFEFYICSKNMDEVSLSDTTINLNNAEITKNLWVINPYCDSIEWEVSDPFMVALDGYSNIGGNKTYEVTLRALRNGEATIMVTMTRGGVEKSFTCTVTVSGLNVEEEKYFWWYYELDTSEASDSQAVGLIFNHSLGMIQTKDIKNVQSKGEIFYKWDGEGRTVLAEVDKSKVDESILQTGLDTENKLVVYVSVPDRVSSVYLHAWDMNIPAPFTFTGEQWPGVLMKECTASDENPVE